MKWIDRRALVRTSLALSLLVCFLVVTQSFAVQAGGLRQIPTGSVPTVTGTPLGAMALIIGDGQSDQLNVRAGPGTSGYEVVGVLIVGQQVPVLGVSAGGEWVEIAYPGIPGGKAWIYKPYVQLSGNPPIVEPPPTPTPKTTPTLDPTLAAEFVVEVAPTRLPTYTAPPPINYPTFQADSPALSPSRVPMGFVIIGMTVVGLFGTLISFLRGR